MIALCMADHAPEDPKFRRAARLIGQPMTNPGDGRTGSIADIEFDPQSGKVQQVLVRTDDGLRNMPPGVSERRGFVRREASEDRRRLHDHQW